MSTKYSGPNQTKGDVKEKFAAIGTDVASHIMRYFLNAHHRAERSSFFGACGGLPAFGK